MERKNLLKEAILRKIFPFSFAAEKRKATPAAHATDAEHFLGKSKQKSVDG